MQIFGRYPNSPQDEIASLAYIILCPAADESEFRAWVDEVDPTPTVSYIDFAWTLEMIIGSLAGIPAKELGPSKGRIGPLVDFQWTSAVCEPLSRVGT